MTEWKLIPSYPDYAASSEGSIRRIVPDKLGRRLKVLSQHSAASGCRYVSLSRGLKEYHCLVHLLVCEAFHGPCPPNKHETGHRNGVRGDNRATNLRWVTKAENAADRGLHGTDQRGDQHWSRKHPDRSVRGEANKGGGGKLTEANVRYIRSDTSPLKDMAEQFGVSMALISQIRRGVAWKHVV